MKVSIQTWIRGSQFQTLIGQCRCRGTSARNTVFTSVLKIQNGTLLPQYNLKKKILKTKLATHGSAVHKHTSRTFLICRVQMGCPFCTHTLHNDSNRPTRRRLPRVSRHFYSFLSALEKQDDDVAPFVLVFFCRYLALLALYHLFHRQGTRNSDILHIQCGSLRPCTFV